MTRPAWRRIAAAAAFLFLAATAAATDVRPPVPSVFSDYIDRAASPQQFLAIPGLSFHQSVGFSYFSSDDRGSAGTGFYMGHFDLRLRDDLFLRWDVGVSSVMTGPEGGQNPDFIIPNVDLTYRPSDRLMMQLQFRQYRSFRTGLLR
ncbi:MAG: hypothetical protein JW876_05715 [Candidatus Krumholzibacteriota bacterium]|nr:hypothetical protein [Candidatus Krumholzibacteriota bacterium]